MKKCLPWVAFSLTAILCACGGAGPALAPGEEVRSDKQRITQPPDSDVPALVAGNTQFALDAYRLLAAEPGNLFFSPHSISVALAMTYAGARSDTESAMAGALRFSLSQAKLHPAFDWLDLALNSRGQGAAGKDGKAFRLHVVNRLFGQTGYHFLPDFLDTLALYYGAGMQLLDFFRDPEGGRKIINEWVEKQTEDRIRDLIPAGAIDTLTRLVLVNAIYFNAAWKEVFDDKLTQNGAFTRLDGTQVQVPMMAQPKSMPAGAGVDFTAVELPYDGDELSMVVIVPTGDFAAFEEALDGAKLASIFASLGSDYATLSMPRFTIDGATISLKKLLFDLGMGVAFEVGQADFSGMDGTRELYIGDVLHQAFVAVDEYGTEAAAATAVIMEGSGLPHHVDINRPFIFLIRDLQTDAVLFIGRVVDPSF
ncbi:MAG: serpin family protein [Myxococcales bacterium]|nr:serpin family protein [Myxococcales bacterium]